MPFSLTLTPAILSAMSSMVPKSTTTLLILGTNRLKATPEVERVNTTSGRFDLILQIAAPTTDALDRVLDTIGAVPGVRSTESLIHLSTKFDRAL